MKLEIKSGILWMMIMLLSISCVCDTRDNSQHIISGTESIKGVCPPWTYLKDNSSECICGDRVDGVVMCNEPSTGPTVFCQFFNDTPLRVCLLTCHCMSYSEKFDTVIMGECPYLCTSHYYYQIPDSNDKLTSTCSAVIQQNRTGQLCSKCVEGYAPSAYSYGIQCADCTNYHHNWIKYLLIAYLPVSVLYLAVIAFKLNAMSPSMNACIFVCQMVSSPSFMSLISGYIYTQTEFPIDLDVITFVYGVWNLDFFRLAFPPLCLHPSITTLQVISLDYIIAMYPLLLIFITYGLVKVHDQSTMAQLLCKPMTWLFTWFNNESTATVSLIDTFNTFFLLSYVKILNTSLNLLTPVQIVNTTGHVLDTYTYYDGSVEYFGSEHIPYAILAICICSTFNIMPLLLLCLYPCRCFQSCLNYCRFTNFNQRLHVFVDTFQGHYKLEPFDCRCFSVFFLVLRITGLFVFYFIKSGFFLIIFGLILIPITICYAIVRPYKNDIYNIIDIVFLSVLIMFCFAAASTAICSLETKCLSLTNVVIVLCGAFSPLYALVISVYKLFPKAICKRFKIFSPCHNFCAHK